MNRKHAALTALATLASLLLRAPATQAAHHSPDDVDINPRLRAQRPARVAVLPAVCLDGDPDVAAHVEARWVELYDGAAMKWIRVSAVRAQLASATDAPSPELESAARQVWRDAEVNAVTARELSDRLGVDAVLSLRIDRWEIADGGRAMVQMTATLTARDGSRLWRISGVAGYGHSRTSSETGFIRSGDVLWVLPADADRHDVRVHLLDRALYTLLARWAWSLPGSPYDETVREPKEPLLAGQPDSLAR